MSTEMIYGVAATVAVMFGGAALVMLLRWAWEWWKARPARERPGVNAVARLQRAGLLWLCAWGVWAFSAWVIHLAPRGGMYGELLYGLPELLGLVTFGSRAAWGALIAAGIDSALWPAFSAWRILWPADDDMWKSTPVALRAVALGAWCGLYLLCIAGAIFGVEPVLDSVGAPVAVGP